MNRKYRFGPGAALITLLAVVLAMSALGVLTLLSARGDEVLSERAARVAESVARLDARAEESLAALDAALAAAPTDQGEAAYRAAVAAALPEGMTLDAEDERFDEIAAEAVKKCRKVEPDCIVHI